MGLVAAKPLFPSRCWFCSLLADPAAAAGCALLLLLLLLRAAKLLFPSRCWSCAILADPAAGVAPVLPLLLLHSLMLPSKAEVCALDSTLTSTHGLPVR